MKVREGALADIDGITRVHVDTWKSAYKGILSDKFLQGISFEKRKVIWKTFFQDSNNKVVVCLNEKEEIIGFVSFGPERANKHNYANELYAIYILEKYQRKGVGKLLLRKVIELLQEKGQNTLIVWVLKDNQSYKFYEYLGGKKIVEDYIEIGGRVLKKVGYGWSDIGNILSII